MSVTFGVSFIMVWFVIESFGGEKRVLKWFLSCLCVVLCLCSHVALAQVAFAQEKRHSGEDPSNLPFDISGLEGRIEFWKLVFGKYGKNHRVFHYRNNPEIIYSVLDFSEFKNTYNGKKLAREEDYAVSVETNRIRAALMHLGSGGKPRSDIERRVENLFAHIPGGKAKYLAAAEDDQIRTQTGVRERYEQGVIRSGRYLYAIEDIFRNVGIPWQISRLPLVESSFDYTAYSAKGAAGIWQFMRSTGSRYLKVGAALDERRDPISASHAAAQYLMNSYKNLGDWPLAITSYNHGLNGVMRSVKSVGTNDLAVIIDKYESPAFGFASQNFFSEFVAAFEIEQNWKDYFPNIQKEAPWYFDDVRLSHPESYQRILKASGVSEEVFSAYNRALQTPITSGRVKVPSDIIIRVPKGHGTMLASRLGRGGAVVSSYNLSASNAQNNSQNDDSASKLASARSSDDKKSLEKKLSKNKKNNSLEKETSESKRASQDARIYVVKAGDTLSAIARRTGVNIGKLKKLNPDAKSVIRPGQRLALG